MQQNSGHDVAFGGKGGRGLSGMRNRSTQGCMYTKNTVQHTAYMLGGRGVACATALTTLVQEPIRPHAHVTPSFLLKTDVPKKCSTLCIARPASCQALGLVSHNRRRVQRRERAYDDASHCQPGAGHT